MEFPRHLEGNYDHDRDKDTLLDPRVAATAIITLMASRDEDRDLTTGLAGAGEREMFLNVARACVIMIQATLLCCCCATLCVLSGLKDKVSKCLFRLEGACLPKRPMNARVPALHPVI